MWPERVLPWISHLPAEWRMHRAPHLMCCRWPGGISLPPSPPTPLPNPTLIRTAGPTAAAAALAVVAPFLLLFAS